MNNPVEGYALHRVFRYFASLKREVSRRQATRREFYDHIR